jgi:hypothetical protein
MTSDQGIKTPRGNRDYPWDEFSPEEYFKYNYVGFREDDRQIVEIVRKFFVEAFSGHPLPSGARGIDVGTGANLYPALTMLPFCDSITLYEYSASNVAWLKSQNAAGWPSWNEAWDKFWADLCMDSAYENVSNPKEELSRRVSIVQGDVLDLPIHERWDTGTMFFVAESITSKRDEFNEAVDHFFAMLKPAAPFAMAFMEHSEGYHVGTQPFPATDIGLNDVSECLGARADNVKLHRLGPGNKPLRERYEGMIVAHGLVKNLP